jgi:hypothetical protein
VSPPAFPASKQLVSTPLTSDASIDGHAQPQGPCPRPIDPHLLTEAGNQAQHGINTGTKLPSLLKTRGR